MIDWLFVVFILLAFIASLTPTRAKLPSGVFEIILGVILVSVLAVFGLNVNTSNHGGVAFLASFGSLALVFLAGAQSRTTTVRNAVKGENVKILVISILSFALPFIVTFLFSSLLLKWDTFASLLVATALSETSVAVVFVSLVETKLADTNFGKRVLKITFVTNLFTASALSALIFTREPFSIHFVIIFLLLFVALFTLPKVIKPILK
ncbi:cation:proton antiporter, partial [Candidatus Micrarchaeota archaeon]|nr:cation:proton antiporter [Candidatus Micrarchaeota archaeon]